MDAIDRASERIEEEQARHDDELQKYKSQLEDAEAKIKSRYAALDSRIRAEAEAHGNPDASGDDVININAGGKLIVARRDKLCQIEGSRLASIFDGRWDSRWPLDSAGRLFLDVNPACFQALVDYLNELAISAADNMPKGPSVDDEDEDSMRQMLYMFGLCEFVGKYPQLDSDIVNTKSKEETLYNWLHEEVNDGHLRLLYRLSRDLPNLDPNDPHATDPGPHSFHVKCDNQGATVCLFKIGEDCMIGGYTSVPWTDGAEFSADDKAFIFYMDDGEEGEEGERRKMKLKDPDDPKAVLGQNCMGPVFGDDLTPINAHLTHFCVYFTPGCRYEPSGIEWIDYAGSVNETQGYEVEEMEVFQVRKRDEFVSAIAIDTAKTFSKDINESLNVKLVAIQQAEREIDAQEREFVEEERLVEFLGVNDENQIIDLNVSGTQMATRRSTLQFCKDCTLARQFDRVWDETRASQEGATLIEHSPYCFGKILDYLRLKHRYYCKLCKEPGRPRVREQERERFAKIVDYYFPGDASKYVLG